MGILEGFTEAVVFLILLVAFVPLLNTLITSANTELASANNITGVTAIQSLLGIIVLILCIGAFVYILKVSRRDYDAIRGE